VRRTAWRVLCLVALASLSTRTFPNLRRAVLVMNDDENELAVLVVAQQQSSLNATAGNNIRQQQKVATVAPPCNSEEKRGSANRLRSCGRLRRNWTRRRQPASPIARRLERHQSNCTLPVATDYVDNNYGMGSHLYVWSQALCNALESGRRLASINPYWLWLDRDRCDMTQAALSPFLCYFPLAEARCGEGTTAAAAAPVEPIPAVNVSDPRDDRRRCSLVLDDDETGGDDRDINNRVNLATFRGAAMEYLFQSVSPLVVREAERQAGLLFPGGIAPEDLITVHIRWGDKFWEMDLPSEHMYVKAVCQLLLSNVPSSSYLDEHQQHKRLDDCNATKANLYVSSEDPRAVQAFSAAAPDGWTVYVDRTIAELDEYRPAKGNRASWTARNTRGRAGLVALGSLLVALEARDFVLTTASNWSRLMNELRKAFLERPCALTADTTTRDNNGTFDADNTPCTRVIDLRPGLW